MGDYIAQVAAAVPLLIGVWLLFASPVLLGAWLLARWMRRRRVHSVRALLAFASGFALLAAPVPTPIITFFLPHGMALFDRHYYPNILHGPEVFAGLWPWIAVSLPATFLLALVVLWRHLRPEERRASTAAVDDPDAMAG